MIYKTVFQFLLGFCQIGLILSGFACLRRPCLNGICIDQLNSTWHQCYCIDGFTGYSCQINWDECAVHPCRNGGTCLDGIASFNCSCPENFAGSLCEYDLSECRSFRPCKNNGTCSFDSRLIEPGKNGSGFYCSCPKGYTGELCEEDVSVCNSTLCQNGGHCVEGEGDRFHCVCPPGWVGDFCQTNFDECSSAPCQNGGICVDLVNDFECACPFSYTGKMCELKMKICPVNPCKNGGFCLEENGKPRCYCVPDYHGKLCEEKYNECEPGPKCFNGGTCIDGVGGFNCSCPPNFYGDLCQCSVNSTDPDCQVPTPSPTTPEINETISETYPPFWTSTITTRVYPTPTITISPTPEESEEFSSPLPPTAVDQTQGVTSTPVFTERPSVTDTDQIELTPTATITSSLDIEISTILPSETFSEQLSPTVVSPSVTSSIEEGTISIEPTSTLIVSTSTIVWSFTPEPSEDFETVTVTPSQTIVDTIFPTMSLSDELVSSELEVSSTFSSSIEYETISFTPSATVEPEPSATMTGPWVTDSTPPMENYTESTTETTETTAASTTTTKETDMTSPSPTPTSGSENRTTPEGTTETSSTTEASTPEETQTSPTTEASPRTPEVPATSPTTEATGTPPSTSEGTEITTAASTAMSSSESTANGTAEIPGETTAWSSSEATTPSTENGTTGHAITDTSPSEITEATVSSTTPFIDSTANGTGGSTILDSSTSSATTEMSDTLPPVSGITTAETSVSTTPFTETSTETDWSTASVPTDTDTDTTGTDTSTRTGRGDGDTDATSTTPQMSTDKESETPELNVTDSSTPWPGGGTSWSTTRDFLSTTEYENVTLGSPTFTLSTTQVPSYNDSSTPDPCNNYCHNDAKCILSPLGPICLCPFKFRGKQCELKAEKVQVPALRGNSFLKYKVPTKSNTLVDVSLKMATVVPDGIVLYTSPLITAKRSNQSRTGRSYALVFIQNGHIVLHFSCGSQSMEFVETRTRVNNGYNFTIDLELGLKGQENSSQLHCISRLSLNGSAFVMSGEQLIGNQTFPSYETIFVGGVEPRLKSSDFDGGTDVIAFLSGFRGCLSNITVNNAQMDMYDDAMDGQEITECKTFACVTNPCAGNSKCIPSSNPPFWECVCPPGYEGVRCQIKVCVTNPCQNGATCNPSQSLNSSSSDVNVTCLCALGFTGPLCASRINITKPSFHPTEDFASYISYYGLPHLSEWFQMKFHFVTANLSQIALLLYIGNPTTVTKVMSNQIGQIESPLNSRTVSTKKPFVDSSSLEDFFSLSFLQGLVAATWNLGSGSRRIVTPSKIDSRLQIHTIYFGRAGRHAWIKVDGMRNITGRSPGPMYNLNVDEELYVGGHESHRFEGLPHDLPLHTGFQGCIFDLGLRVKNKLFLPKPFRGRNVKNCFEDC